MEDVTQNLNALIRMHYADWSDEVSFAISPKEIARSVMHEIDPQGNAPRSVREAAECHFLELARAYCKSRQSEMEEQALWMTIMGDLQLPPRYAVWREVDGGWEVVYVERNDLTEEQLRDLVTELNDRANAIARQAQALKVEFAARKSRFAS